jgi:putative FmdB family regulatory protein
MPIYEYQCAKCGEFEVSQRITDDPLKRCPTCRSKVKKLISNTSFQLKGSGWYQTDYGGKKTDAATKDKPAADTTSTASTDKSDAPKEAPAAKNKPASKSETSSKAA